MPEKLEHESKRGRVTLVNPGNNTNKNDNLKRCLLKPEIRKK
jgi:hypothetical protein